VAPPVEELAPPVEDVAPPVEDVAPPVEDVAPPVAEAEPPLPSAPGDNVEEQATAVANSATTKGADVRRVLFMLGS
jgi:hypothetical protein